MLPGGFAALGLKRYFFFKGDGFVDPLADEKPEAQETCRDPTTWESGRGSISSVGIRLAPPCCDATVLIVLFRFTATAGREKMLNQTKPKLNRSIPGELRDAELARIMELAAAVPKGGVVVEIGSLYGLSSWHLAKACAPGVTVFCVDPWQREQWVIDIVEKPLNAPPFCRAAFESYTADCDNIVMIEGYSPQIARGWNLPVDLYFEDAVHTNPTLATNLAFWSERVKPGGVIAGHDYAKYWPEVMEEVDGLAKRVGSKLTVVDTVWSLRKPSSFRNFLSRHLRQNEERPIQGA